MIKKVTDIVNNMDGNEAVEFLINNEDCYVVSKDVIQQVKREAASEAISNFVDFARDKADDAWFLYDTVEAYKAEKDNEND